MKYSVTYINPYSDVSVQSYFDLLDDAICFYNLILESRDIKSANLAENHHGDYDDEDGYFSGTVEILEQFGEL